MPISRFLVAATFVFALNASAFADEALPPIKVRHEGDINYVYGGMDELERKALGKLAERYQMQLSFSRAGSSEKVTGVKVTLIDYKGDRALEKVVDGPIFFANLPAGRWTVKAELDGETYDKTMDVNGRFYITLAVQFKGGAQGK
jgi:hypothetical protein